MLDAGFVGQTDREKAIEEMLTIITNIDRDCTKCDRHDSYNDCASCTLSVLYDYILRKADEVRKETVKEVIEWFDSFINRYPRDKIIKYAKEDFGVEVQEEGHCSDT